MTKRETELFKRSLGHYLMAQEDLDTRKDTLDTADELFRSYIDEDNWPYSSLIFVPRVFTSIFEKTSRLIGGKPRGRLIPREGGDVLKAKINNVLLDYQWDDAGRVDGEPLVAKWAMMDMNARKYGAAFGLCKWRYERKVVKIDDNKEPVYKSQVFYDGPYFQVLNNRDVLLNPSYSTVKNWFQHREYLTLSELFGVNDAARGKPVYKNLDELLEKVRRENKVMDTRETNYSSRNKQMKGLQDFLGRDETNKVIEIVTEYQDNRWITFAPKHGVVIRDIENPYKHQQIPVVMLKYYPIDDDIYGVPEWEPIEKLQKAVNAISSQYIDAVNMELYPVFGVDPTRVRLHTMEFTPRAKWIISGDPRTAVAKMDFSAPNSISQFKTVYQMLVGEMQEALGETSAMTSNLDPFGGNKKTATEIKDLATQRLSRDNFNQIFLAEAIKKQMMFWQSMNQQLLFKGGQREKIIRIVGKDAIQYFEQAGLSESGFTDESMDSVATAMEQGLNINPTEYQTPLYPVGNPPRPKMEMSPQSDIAELTIEPDDLSGNYDFIADIEAMSAQSQEQVIAAKKAAIDMMGNQQIMGQLQMAGKTIKAQELLEDFLESLGFKDAGKYFEDIKSSPQLNGTPIIPGGEGAIAQGPANSGVNPAAGVSNAPTAPGGQNQPLMAGPTNGQV